MHYINYNTQLWNFYRPYPLHNPTDYNFLLYKVCLWMILKVPYLGILRRLPARNFFCKLFHAVLGHSRPPNSATWIFLPQRNPHECCLYNYFLTSWFPKSSTVQCSGPWPRWSTSMLQFLCPFLSPSENAQTKTTFSLLFAHHFVLLRISLKSWNQLCTFLLMSSFRSTRNLEFYRVCAFRSRSVLLYFPILSTTDCKSIL